MIPIKIMTQPDDLTCGPTSLHAVYHYFNDKISLENVIQEVDYLEAGGTLAVFLAIHALKRGYKTRIYTYNLKMFDPTWFIQKDINLIEKLKLQLKYKPGIKFYNATIAYIEYLSLGGKLLFMDLTPGLLKKYFNNHTPILAGLSATYLYQTSREAEGPHKKSIVDDVRGHPVGHFVVLCGYDQERNHVIVADPYKENPISKNNYYSVKIQRLINAIMLGIVTYDANFLIIEPAKG